jgi:hypothetical protein
MESNVGDKEWMGRNEAASSDGEGNETNILGKI